MFSPRWMKLVRDLRAEKKRVILMTAAIAVSLAAVGAVLGAYSILTREISVNYLGTNPASATVVVENGIDARALDIARRHPAVARAEAKDVILARALVGKDWRPMLLFVADDAQSPQLNAFFKVRGSWPPASGSMFIEVTAIPMLEADVGQSVTVKAPGGRTVSLPISGIVHDPGLAPAWQERSGYGYISKATLELLGERPVLHELRFLVKDRPGDVRHIENVAADIGEALVKAGYDVHDIRVPPPLRHPHQSQMTTILLLFLVFSIMALVLGAILTATSLSAMLARQVREIGVMKTLGAGFFQIAGMYLVMVAAMGALSLLPAIGLGIIGARAFAGAVSRLLNFNLTSTAIPLAVFAVQAAAGILVPLLVSAFPVSRAGRITVRSALDQHGVSSDSFGEIMARLPAFLRNVLRRPVRLALTVGLLAAGGAMFMTALNVLKSQRLNVDKFYLTRHYDVEFRFRNPPDSAALKSLLEAVPGVKNAEAWGFAPAAFATGARFDFSRTYPDLGHAGFSVLAPPATTNLVSFPVIAGRWLLPDDTNVTVLNHSARALSGANVGDEFKFSIEGKVYAFRVIGVVEEVGYPAAAYVTDRTLERVAGLSPGRMFRISSDASELEDRMDIVRKLESVLENGNVAVERGLPIVEHRTAIGDHIMVLVRSLIAMAVIMAIVGMLGLSSTMSISVIERTKEFGIMKTIGAVPARIVRMVLGEAFVIGLISFVAAFALSLPITAAVDWLIGTLGFLAPLPFAVAWEATLVWLALSALVALVATAIPARGASRILIRDALVQV